MAIVFRVVTGTVYTPQGVVLPAGKLWVHATSPVASEGAFVPPDDAETDIVNGVFTLSLASGCVYDFLVKDEQENHLWHFQAEVPSDSSDPISLTDLFSARV